jgi:hypothetical protein
VIQDQDVDASHVFNGRVHNIFASLPALEICLLQMKLPAFLLDELLSLLSISLLLGRVNDGGLCTLHRIQDGHCPSNATITTRDEGLQPLKLASGFVGLVAAIRGRELVIDRRLTRQLVLLPGDFFLTRDGSLVP